MSSQRLNNRIPSLRTPGDSTLSRTQDGLRQVLQPALTPVLNSPMVGNDPPNWITPEFADTNWVNSLLSGTTNPFLGTTAKLQFHKDALGYVHVKGVVKTLSGRGAASLLFTLPANFGPAELHLIPVLAAGAAALLAIYPTGAVAAPAIAINQSLILGDIVFLAEGGGTGGTGPATGGHIGPSPH